MRLQWWPVVLLKWQVDSNLATSCSVIEKRLLKKGYIGKKLFGHKQQLTPDTPIDC